MYYYQRGNPCAARDRTAADQQEPKNRGQKNGGHMTTIEEF